MTKQALILNMTRMGDLAQTVPLLSRLNHEWPGVAIDLVVDRSFASMAALLPGLRQILAYDFQGLLDLTRTGARDVLSLYHDVAGWARPLTDVGYDRVINLTFNRRSGLLAAYIGAGDTRGVTATPDGMSVVKNPWLTYFTDLHQYRRFNRFNLVDLYALGGSGPGPHAPLNLSVTPAATEWAARFLQANAAAHSKVAVQIAASDPIKAWRPEYFGHTMAAMSRRIPVTFVLIGTPGEAHAAEQAVAVYQAAGGMGSICNAVGQTDLRQLVGLLAQCRLLLTNDTGPMHLAVGMGTPVIDLSVGHVDFQETGPYGSGHWVIQPDLGCAPCGFDQICPHHACKDRLVPEHVAALCLHVLGAGPFPSHWTGVRVYESVVDEDGLISYQLRAGQADAMTDWYGTFWRTFWYEAFTGRPSRVKCDDCPFDIANERSLFERLAPRLKRVVDQIETLVRLSRQRPLPAAALKAAQVRLAEERQEGIAQALTSPAFAPIAVALLRELHNCDTADLQTMAKQQAMAYRRWSDRVTAIMGKLTHERSHSGVHSSQARKLNMPLLAF